MLLERIGLAFLVVSFWVTLMMYVKEHDKRDTVTNVFTVVALNVIVFLVINLVIKLSLYLLARIL